MIRPLTMGDVHECARLYVEVFQSSPWNETWPLHDARTRLRDFLAAPGAAGVGLLDDSELIGFALGRRERSMGEDHFYLQEMCVHPDRQRQGHGGSLLQGLMDHVRGIAQWYLLTARSSAAAEFYTRNDFTVSARMQVPTRRSPQTPAS